MPKPSVSVAVLVLVVSLTSCANFRKLGEDLEILDDTHRVTGVIGNADSMKVPVRAVIMEWDRSANVVSTGDMLELTSGGTFTFLVKHPANQYVAAYADANRNGKYDHGEPMWIHRGKDGGPAPVDFGSIRGKVRVDGWLSTAEKVPAGLEDALNRALAGRELKDFITKQGVRFALGEIAKLDDPMFASTRGEDGLWTPATFAIHSGFGVYFLEPYDPAKTPVLFVHGAGGSPQDWRQAMEKIDRRRYQPWFYMYPSGMRLAEAAGALDDGVRLLHERHRFNRLHVVAHSMGGLVARAFLIRNVVVDHNRYINTFITFSSPWNGHEAAAMGVKYAPEVVPSWRDMTHGSDFLAHLFDERLKGRVDHHLFYSHRAKRSPILPAENDGTVSVASELRKEAGEDAVEVRGFDEDHISILSSKAALSAARGILDRASP